MDIEFLLVLQQLRETLGPGVENVMNIITGLPTNPVTLLLLCLIYWCIDKDRGIFVMFNFGFGAVLNQLLKVTFCIYRPWIRDARITPSQDALPGATGYSFPSGHSQSIGSAFGSLGWTYRKKNRFILWVCFLLVAIVAFSRNYLGVHTPQDVLVGLCEAGFTLLLMVALFRWIARNPEKDARILVFGILVVVGSIAYAQFKSYPIEIVDNVILVDPEEMRLDSYTAGGALLAIVVGWFLERRLVGFSTDCSLGEKVIRVACGVACIAVVYLFGIRAIKSVAPAELYEFSYSLLLIGSGIFVGPALAKLIYPSSTRTQ